MDGPTDDDIRSLEYIAEELAGVIFDETVFERLVRLGLSEPSGGTWVLTEKGRQLLAGSV
jgi:hypothetical protein